MSVQNIFKMSTSSIYPPLEPSCTNNNNSGCEFYAWFCRKSHSL